MKHNHTRDDPAKQNTHAHAHVNVNRIVVVFVCQRKKKITKNKRMKKSKGTVVYFEPEFKITEKKNKEDLDGFR